MRGRSHEVAGPAPSRNPDLEDGLEMMLEPDRDIVKEGEVD